MTSIRPAKPLIKTPNQRTPLTQVKNPKSKNLQSQKRKTKRLKKKKKVERSEDIEEEGRAEWI